MQQTPIYTGTIDPGPANEDIDVLLPPHHSYAWAVYLLILGVFAFGGILAWSGRRLAVNEIPYLPMRPIRPLPMETKTIPDEYVDLEKKEIEKFSELDREAKEIADSGGPRPNNNDGPVALIIAVGMFIILRVFAGVTMRNDETAFWPVIIFTIAGGGGFYIVQRLRHRAWIARYKQALDGLRGLKKRE
jgi:hypothetical protein